MKQGWGHMGFWHSAQKYWVWCLFFSRFEQTSQSGHDLLFPPMSLGFRDTKCLAVNLAGGFVVGRWKERLGMAYPSSRPSMICRRNLSLFILLLALAGSSLNMILAFTTLTSSKLHRNNFFHHFSILCNNTQYCVRWSAKSTPPIKCVYNWTAFGWSTSLM